ncbi:wax ester/triacylglycerol synthase domain-containing protein [Nocardia shimofusensis]|uniref:wax ester/triacylglycerol synthase domain-containing protein n=1 Tax=Nocardia shimofusensis TaxID=228596 RepID=UPI000A069CE0|nr:wax ester/triacylglycerol synthase domain-containing protein [Nocardia shimofusensis]
MTQTDLFAWSMEHDPLLRSTIVTVLILDTEPDRARMVELMDRGTRVVPRFRHVLSVAPMNLTPPRWKADTDFDLSWHLRWSALPAPGDMSTVLDFARTEMMTAFDPIRPLWTFTVLTGLSGGRCAAVLKVHHSLTDGIGGIQIAGEMLDLAREGTEREPVGDSGPPDSGALADIVEWNLSTGYEVVRAGLSTAASAARQTLTSPVRAARSGAGLAWSLARFVRPITSTLSPVMTERGQSRRLSVLEAPLAELSAAAHRAECTLNDAYLAALLIGLRAYHERQGASVEQLRLTMPISTRTAADPIGGNRITLARFAVRADIDDAIAMMRAVHATVEGWRHEQAIPLTNAVAAVLNRLPSMVLAQMLEHVDFVASDVPGSPVPLYLAGAEIEQMHAFGPTLGTAFNATLVSHIGTCYIGLDIDTAAVTDPAEFLDCIDSGLRAVRATGARPPETAPPPTGT